MVDREVCRVHAEEGRKEGQEVDGRKVAEVNSFK